MKKVLFIFILLCVLIIPGCGNRETQSNQGSSDTKETNTVIDYIYELEYETITLTLDNYQKFIAMYEQAFDTDKTREKRVYYNFYGAEGCRFDNCVITYGGDYSGSIELNISGDGQIIIYNTLKPSFSITSITGTVKVPKIK